MYLLLEGGGGGGRRKDRRTEFTERRNAESLFFEKAMENKYTILPIEDRFRISHVKIGINFSWKMSTS